MTMNFYDEIPVGPPPSPYLGGCLQSLQPLGPENVSLATILDQPMSKWTVLKEYSDASDVSSILSFASSDRSNTSVETAITEDENSTEIAVALAIDIRMHPSETFGRDGVVPGEVFSGNQHHQSLPPICGAVAEAIHELYTLVRLSSEKHEEILEELDDTIGTISEVASITPLNDGSWELLVLKAYLPFLRNKIRNKYQDMTLDTEYDPVQPSQDDTECWGLDAAKTICLGWCAKRAEERMINSWFTAKIYYAYLLEVKIRGTLIRLNGFEELGGAKMII